MKKKIILLVLCAVLLLMFTSSSYGGFDPNYMEREEEHPWDHLSSPSLPEDAIAQFGVLVVVVSFNLDASTVICVSKRLSSNKGIGHPSSIPNGEKWRNN